MESVSHVQLSRPLVHDLSRDSQTSYSQLGRSNKDVGAIRFMSWFCEAGTYLYFFCPVSILLKTFWSCVCRLNYVGGEHCRQFSYNSVLDSGMPHRGCAIWRPGENCGRGHAILLGCVFTSVMKPDTPVFT